MSRFVPFVLPACLAVAAGIGTAAAKVIQPWVRGGERGSMSQHVVSRWHAVQEAGLHAISLGHVRMQVRSTLQCHGFPWPPAGWGANYRHCWGETVDVLCVT